jgi:hypothetical protein
MASHKIANTKKTTAIYPKTLSYPITSLWERLPAAIIYFTAGSRSHNQYNPFFPDKLLLLQFNSDFVLARINPIIFKIGFSDQGDSLLTRVSFNRLMQAK